MISVSDDRVGRVVAALSDFWRANGYPPTTRQLVASMGLRAQSNVCEALQAAEVAGLVYATPGRRVYVPLWVKDAIAAYQLMTEDALSAL